MKAAVRYNYGPPEVLQIKEVATPRPKPNEVLIRVYATSVNRSDVHVLTGKPFFMRLFTGLFKPRHVTTGTDFAGIVEDTGSSVTLFKKGDRIMGFGDVMGVGSHAQYLTISESRGMIAIPDKLSFTEAAALTEGAFYAVAAILSLKPKAGQKALVYGASGSIGSAYVQYLRHLNVYVTAVCRKQQTDLMKSLGASKVIDYVEEDFTQDDERYDYIFDAVGKTSFTRCRRLLKEKGFFASSGNLADLLIWPIVTKIAGGKRAVFIPPQDVRTSMLYIKDLAERGHFRPVIDRKYPLEQIVDAYKYVATGEKIGNVILTLDQ